ncbi:MAG: rubredoxin [Syntrophobacterales bacterium]|jgi:rubredoxin|nr:rubredoxin [Syntrophobacterales bacterium]
MNVRFESEGEGYVCDPAADESSANGIASDTLFGKVSDTWVGPICGVPKSEFEKI